MTKLCNTYIKKIKTLFPLIGKSERNFIKAIRINVNDFLADAPNSSLDDLYKEFGKPEDVINSYYVSVNTDNIIKRIKISKYVKILITAFIICLLSLTILKFYISYTEHQVFMDEQIQQEEIIIE